MQNHIGTFFTVRDHAAFIAALQSAIDSGCPQGIYTGDNLFTFGRNLGFLNEQEFAEAISANISDEVEKSIVWRLHTLCWASKFCLGKPGDYVECGTYQGFCMRVVCDYLKFGEVDKKMYLYDLFEHNEAMPHHAMPEHGPDLYGRVLQRFEDLSNVTITQGKVPDSFEQALPEVVAFAHIDMNSAEAEIAALEVLWDRVTPGGIVVLDDYGWAAYQAQQIAEDEFMAERGYSILELPTGQGLVIK